MYWFYYDVFFIIIIFIPKNSDLKCIHNMLTPFPVDNFTWLVLYRSHFQFFNYFLMCKKEEFTKKL